MGKPSVRTRIVEAVVSLHEERGPAATTITAIAERAGVQRLTVYRHFPDEGALLRGCSAHWRDRHPPPEPSEWAGIPDPPVRLETALLALYGYFDGGRRMLDQVLRDADRVPALGEVLASFRDYMAEIAGGLSAGWGVDEGRQRRIRAAVGHALRFPTWQSLRAEGLSNREAAAMMMDLVVRMAETPAPDPDHPGTHL